MNRLLIIIASTILAVCSINVYASGSHSMGDGNMAKSSYNKGKTLLHKQLMCKSCPLNEMSLDKTVAANLIAKLTDGSPEVGSLSPAEKQSVVTYLQERFELN